MSLHWSLRWWLTICAGKPVEPVPFETGVYARFHFLFCVENKNGSDGGTRTPDPAVNSRLLYRLSYI